VVTDITEEARFTTLTSAVSELARLTTGRFTTLGMMEFVEVCRARTAPVNKEPAMSKGAKRRKYILPPPSRD
jgi:hypothetical protein